MVKKNKLIFSDERKNKDLTAFAQTLRPFVRQAAEAGGMVEAEILENWENIAGQELYAYCRPEKIVFSKGERQNGVLHVFVPNGAFALELQHREKFVLDKINTYFGFAAASRLRINQNCSMDLSPVRHYPVEKVKKILVTPQEETYITKLSEGVENENLKNALIKLGVSVFNDNKEE